MQLVELLKDRNNWVDWKFLTKKDNLVSVATGESDVGDNVRLVIL